MGVFKQSVEGGQGGGERAAVVVGEACEAFLEHGRTLGAHGRELVAPGIGELHADGARVVVIARLADEAVGLEPADQHGHRRLGNTLGVRQLRHAEWPLVVEPAQHEQRTKAAPAMSTGAHEVCQQRDAPIQLSGQIFDSHTI